MPLGLFQNLKSEHANQHLRFRYLLDRNRKIRFYHPSFLVLLSLHILAQLNLLCYLIQCPHTSHILPQLQCFLSLLATLFLIVDSTDTLFVKSDLKIVCWWRMVNICLGNCMPLPMIFIQHMTNN